MTTAYLLDDALHLRFTVAEKIAGLLRNVRVPLSAIRSVEVVPDGLAASSGLRAPGLALPGVRRLGTWRGREGKTLVAVRRGQPAVRVVLTSQPYSVLLIGLDDAHEVAATLRAALTGSAQ